MEAPVGTADARASRASSLVRFLARESLPIVVCCALAVLAVVLLPQLLSTDGWLALVAGRLVVQQGLPHHDTLTVLGHGRSWVDQQWLGQVAFYGLDVLGGARVVLAANLLLVIGAFVAAVVYARKRGGAATTVALVAFVALLPFLVTGMYARPQSFVYLPFVALVALLSSRERISTQRVAFMIAVLIVWSNVHGSVLLAASLVALRGALDAWESRRLGRVDRRAVVLLGAPWLCLLASPYTFHLVAYYAKTAFNPSFSTYLSYWAPTSFSPVSVPLLLLLFGSIWLLGCVGDTYSLFERWLLVFSTIIGLLAVRNWTFSALLVVMLLPVALDRALRKRVPRAAPWFGAPIAGVIVVATAIATFASFANVPSKVTENFPPAAGLAVAEAARAPDAQIYAGIKFADWLMWAHPNLEGKLVLDARYELLTVGELRRLVLFGLGTGVDVPLGRPTVYVLDPGTDEHAIAALRPDVHVLYDSDHAFVARVRN